MRFSFGQKVDLIFRANKTRAPQQCLLFSARCGFYFKAVKRFLASGALLWIGTAPELFLCVR
jgi:hypothetical protein